MAVRAGWGGRGGSGLKEGEDVKSNGLRVTGQTTIEIEGQDRPACIVEGIAIIYQ